MKKTIYISGPISDNTTGLPCDGWQKKFHDADHLLRRMGFNTVSPVDIAAQTEEEWKQIWQEPAGVIRWSGPYVNSLRKNGPTRATYVTACLQVMNTEHLAGRLQGMYLLGSDHDPLSKQRIYHSHGVQMEIHMALMLGIPMFAEFYDGNEVDMHMLPVKDGKRLCEGGKFGKENWSGRF